MSFIHNPVRLCGFPPISTGIKKLSLTFGLTILLSTLMLMIYMVYLVRYNVRTIIRWSGVPVVGDQASISTEEISSTTKGRWSLAASWLIPDLTLFLKQLKLLCPEIERLRRDTLQLSTTNFNTIVSFLYLFSQGFHIYLKHYKPIIGEPLPCDHLSSFIYFPLTSKFSFLIRDVFPEECSLIFIFIFICWVNYYSNSVEDPSRSTKTFIVHLLRKVTIPYFLFLIFYPLYIRDIELQQPRAMEDVEEDVEENEYRREYGPWRRRG
ncbi:hypothetical protein CRE_19342 [Caenorhabditis remanei]|uniref:Uncharacterized protein n=1 Tax=Caenorhabditis remanei TaxID=31234 RepID=E3N531_CAERE|nr:hypothetical protein CRE_19342 [Caenorhabditis remanei]